MVWSKNGERETYTFDNLISARKYAITKMAKKGKINGRQNNYYAITTGRKTVEMVQVRNDGRSNYMVVVRGPGGNKSYLQILNAAGKPVSPKISVYSMNVGWGKFPWGINYKG